MDIEAYLEAVFGFRVFLDDTDFESSCNEQNLSDKERKQLLESWTANRMIEVLEYFDGENDRHIFFRYDSAPSILRRGEDIDPVP